jgi:phospholipid transport system substrate-binding protein
MLTRRTQLLLTGLALGFALVSGALAPAQAQAPDAAAEFVRQTGAALVKVVNGNMPESTRRQEFQQIVDRTVDVDSIARFALGRFWRAATPEQQKEYTRLFHQVLLNSISAKLGEYRGVQFSVGRTIPREGGVAVLSTIVRPNNPPTEVEWVVADVGGSPKIEDVVAEGTSLRVTQRSDYVSFLQHNGGSIPTLINAMRQQLAQAGG